MQMCVLSLYCHARLRMRADLQRLDGSWTLFDGRHHHGCVKLAFFSILSDLNSLNVSFNPESLRLYLSDILGQLPSTTIFIFSA